MNPLSSLELNRKLTARAIGSNEWVKAAEWYGKPEYEDINVFKDVKAGDEIKIVQEIHSGIPAYCLVEQINEFIVDNLRGSDVSDEIGWPDGSIERIGYDVKCIGDLWEGARVTIRYKIHSVPTGSIGVAPIIIIIYGALAILILYFAAGWLKAGTAFVKSLGEELGIVLLLVAGAVGIMAIVSLIKAIRSK